MACNCAHLMDEHLKLHNTRLDRAWILRSGNSENPNLMLSTSKIETKKRGPAKSVFFAYCPMCGVRYDDE